MIKTISSREIARVTGQRHTEVMRKIESFIGYISTDARLRSSDYFIKSHYIARNGERRVCFECTEQGCEMYANKLTGRKGTIFTAFYVKEFNQMKNHLPINIVHNLLDTRDGLNALSDTLRDYAVAKPKARYYDKEMRNPGLMTATKIAKNYGWSAQKLNKVLHRLGVIYWQGDSWTLYSQYQDMALGAYQTTGYDHNSHARNLWKWNQRGKKFIYDVLKRCGILPKAEQLDLLNYKIERVSHNGRY